MDNYDKLKEQGTDQQFYDKTFPASFFDIIPHKLRSDRNITASEYRFLALVASMYNYKNELPCWAGNTFLAEEEGKSIKTIKNMITSLKQKGYLRVEFSQTRRYLIVNAMTDVPKFKMI